MEILTGIAHDIYLGATIWPDAQKIERRFNLCGFTMTQVTRMEWDAKAIKAVRYLNTVRFETEEIDRMIISCAHDALRDFENIYGMGALNRLKSYA